MAELIGAVVVIVVVVVLILITSERLFNVAIVIIPAKQVATNSMNQIRSL